MDFPCLKNYEKGIPHSLKPYPERTLLDVVSDTARETPDHTALIFKGRRLSYFGIERLKTFLNRSSAKFCAERSTTKKNSSKNQ